MEPARVLSPFLPFGTDGEMLRPRVAELELTYLGSNSFTVMKLILLVNN